MHIVVVEVNHPSKTHPELIARHNHILIGGVRTLCGHRDFNGEGKPAELDNVDNLCGNCRKLCR
jgi:hypothetical protein